MDDATPGPWEACGPHAKGETIGRPSKWTYVQHNFPAAPYEGELSDEYGIYPPMGEAGPVALVAGEANAKLIASTPEALADRDRAIAALRRLVLEGDPHEDPECPQDDTCECKLAAEINDLLKHKAVPPSTER